MTCTRWPLRTFHASQSLAYQKSGRDTRTCRWNLQQCQSINHAAVDDVLFNDLGYIFSSYLGIPDAIRINHHRGSDCTETDRGTLCEHDTSLWILALVFLAEKNSSGEQFSFKNRFHLGTVHCRTRLSRTYEDVMT